jgi:uncharacterized membrane protein YcaP (DUF421 family)
MFVSDPVLDGLLRGLVLGWVGLLWVVFVARVNGLSTFSKMTPFDFVATVATGSLLAQAAGAEDLPNFLQGLAAVAGIIALQRLLGEARSRWGWAQALLENQPVVVMRDGEVDEEALGKTVMTLGDVRAKLREANALDVEQVRALVLESTGDVAVLHGDDVDETLLEGVNKP